MGISAELGLGVEVGVGVWTTGPWWQVGGRERGVVWESAQIRICGRGRKPNEKVGNFVFILVVFVFFI